MIRGTIAGLLLTLSTVAFAQKSASPATSTATTSTTATAVAAPPQRDSDSRETRDQLRDLLRGYPPQLGTVLKLDPTLLSNESYMANYPSLAAFARQHPEIEHNPDYFLSGLSMPDNESAAFAQWRGIMSDIGGFTAFLVLMAILIWIIKTVVEQRRWNRLSAMQTEVHTKLFDRFTSNEELLAYLQSPAGKRILESAPMPLEAAPRPMSAPVGKIFWSLQAGLVLIAAGIGFDLVSLRVPSPGSAAVYGLGVIAMLIGVALVLSAIIFYALSKRFGLWQPNVASSE